MNQQCKFPREKWSRVIEWKGKSDTQLQNCPTSNWTIFSSRSTFVSMLQLCTWFVFVKIENVSFTSLRIENDCKVWHCLNFCRKRKGKINLTQPASQPILKKDKMQIFLLQMIPKPPYRIQNPKLMSTT